jgi:hypothetical protein
MPAALTPNPSPSGKGEKTLGRVVRAFVLREKGQGDAGDISDEGWSGAP